MNETPVRIFVLWHPEYSGGIEIARAIFNWFRTPDGYGIQVHYRSEADPRRNDGLPPPMPLHRAMVNLVVVLAESKMVRDRLWRDWLTTLAESDTVDQECERAGTKEPARFVQIYPVALQATAYKLPGPLRKLNFISARPGASRGEADASVGSEVLLSSLRTQLTEAFARILGDTLEEMHAPRGLFARVFSKLLAAFTSKMEQRTDEPPKIKVFISHAKRDGTEVARALRDYIYQNTQLSAFFDENDIALGFKFADVLKRSIRSETVAMISVNGDHYSSRPWCRREVHLFSRPTRKHGVWERAPLLVVQSMDGGRVANAVPEFGNAPVLRWRDGDEALCIDTLLREAIFRTYHSYVASGLRTRLDKEGPASNRVFVNWPPDPLGLDTVIREWEKERIAAWRAAVKAASENKKRRPPRPKLRPLDLIYPGRGLSSIELDALTERHPEVRLLSYNEVRAFG